MSKTKFDEMMQDNNIILVMVANLSNNNIMTIGNKSKLESVSLVENLFGDMERVQALNDSLKGQIMPQAWNQGIVKCLVCKPVDYIVIGLFFHEDRNEIESYHFGKMLNELIRGIWEDDNLYMESIKNDIKILKQMKLLGENDDIDIFDEAIYRISLKGDNSLIKELCEVLDDSTSTPSAVENLIQCIFTIANRCGLEEGIYEILNSADKTIINAKRWFIQINRMILNYEPFNNAYISAIKRLSDEELSSVIDILYEIKDKYKGKYDKKIDSIVEEI